MSTSPSTLKAEPGHGGIDWEASSTLHRSGDGGGLLNDLKTVRNGSLGELIRFVMTLPDDQRSRYVIEKAGDHRLSPGEILMLSRRADFPLA